ncbi:MAG: 4Fe-4S dicluster domain-containing protein [bacterium JZ-2024 1]
MKFNSRFPREVASLLGGFDFLMCYQCGKCTSLCPVYLHTPSLFQPRKILEKILVGRREILQSREIWMCTTCYECYENCPQKVNLAEVFIALRNLAVREGYVPKELAEEIKQIQQTGYLYPLGEQVKKVRAELNLPTLTQDGSRVESVLSARKEAGVK